jgi:hypothetical protein
MSKFALLFLLVFFGGIYAAITYNGAAAFVVYQVVYFLNPDTRWWSAGIPGMRYSFIVVILMMGLLAKRYRDYSVLSPWSEQAPLKWMMALLVMYYIAYSFALHNAMHSKFTFEYTKLVIIMLVAYKLINSPLMLKVCMWAYLTGCTYIGYLATLKGRNSSGRVEDIGMVDAPDANDTAAALAPAAVMLMYFAWQGNKKVKLLATFMGALIANGLVLINSRGSFLGVVASLGLFLSFMIFSRHQKKGQKFTAIFMIMFGLSGALYVTDDLFWERMRTIQNDDANTSGASRIQFWLTTLDMLEDHPWGMGVYGYNVLAPIYMDDETRGGVEFRSVHSMWFQGLSEVGWIGFGMFFFMLLSLALSSRRAKKFVVSREEFDVYYQLLALECALIAYLVAGTFINRFRAEILYWMILFIAVAVNVYYLQPKREEMKLSGKRRKAVNQQAKRAVDE